LLDEDAKDLEARVLGEARERGEHGFLFHISIIIEISAGSQAGRR
jgi:hypothetical protein